MNELTQTGGTSLAITESEAIRVLGNSLYPGAKPESIALVLSYCRANGLDPFLKPVHIVPTSIKLPNGRYEMRDVLMPGIADYRIKASRSGQYAGKSEPEFGPDVTETLGDVNVTYPAWCRVTVKRIVAGEARDFAATERWLENYATAGRDTDAPNKMWKKRAYGQLAKCAEAQALRMAFPEFSGGAPTAEEMEGKTINDFEGKTIDGKSTTTVPLPPDTRSPWLRAFEEKLTAEGNGNKWLKLLRLELSAAPTREDVEAASEVGQVLAAIESAPTDIRRQINEMIADAMARFDQPAEDEAIDGSLADDDAAAPIISRIQTLDILALNKLDGNAEFKAEIRALAKPDYDRVRDAIDARMAELRAAA